MIIEKISSNQTTNTVGDANDDLETHPNGYAMHHLHGFNTNQNYQITPNDSQCESYYINHHAKFGIDETAVINAST